MSKLIQYLDRDLDPIYGGGGRIIYTCFCNIEKNFSPSKIHFLNVYFMVIGGNVPMIMAPPQIRP